MRSLIVLFSVQQDYFMLHSEETITPPEMERTKSDSRAMRRLRLSSTSLCVADSDRGLRTSQALPYYLRRVMQTRLFSLMARIRGRENHDPDQFQDEVCFAET